MTGTPPGFSKTLTWKSGFWLALVIPMSGFPEAVAPVTVRSGS